MLAIDETELKDSLVRLQNKVGLEKILVQELIPLDGTNKTISFTAFCEDGEIRTYWMGEKIREHPVRFGTATFARSIYEVICFEQSVPLLRTIKYNGVCEVEYLRDPRDGRFKLIEINARTWLWTGLAKACGVDYANLLYNYLAGYQNSYPTAYKIGVKWINWFTDIPYFIISLFKTRMRVNDYFNSLRGFKVDALWSGSDKMPFFCYILLLPLYRLTR